VVTALSDKLPVRRGAAAEALCRAGAVDPLPQVRLLLKDDDATVRLRTALALAYRRERDAIPVLIALLRDLTPSQLWPAEDVLRALAGEQAPALPLGNDEAARLKCHDAWAAWWRDHGARADLARLDPQQRQLGYTLVVVQTDNGTGRVVEVGMDGKPRWQISGLSYPLDAQMLPGERVLIAESSGGRVTERNLKGEILWEKKIASPITCQRLPNGNTFITTYNQFLEVDRTGKEVSSASRSHRTALKLRDGHICCVADNSYLRLDAGGKEVKRFAVNGVNTVGALDVVPGGGVVIAEVFGNKVVEYNAGGKVVWQATVQAPTSVVRLRNGNTLVGAWNTGMVTELSPAGKVVWQCKIAGEFSRARRR
jgi:hypothetical protein